MRFGKKFADHRKKRKMSVEATAKSIGISRSYIVLIEGGRRHPSAKVMPKIAETFELEITEILNWYLEDMRERMEESFK